MALVGKRLAAALVALAASGVAHAAPWYFQPQATALGREIDWLHQYVMWVIVVIFIGVFGFMFYACYAHRKSKGHKAAQFHENTTVEILWTAIPALILVAIAWPTTKLVLAQKDTSAPDITIKATGYQWFWGYDYLRGGEGQGISFMSRLSTPREQILGRAAKGENYLLEVDHEMVVPVGKKVRLLTTAADVIHAWFVPALATKQDAIPGFIRDTWFRADKIGIYRGQCAELCGKDHAFMPIVVRVVSEEDYGKWVAAQKSRMAKAAEDNTKTFSVQELMQRGEKVYNASCATCHRSDGRGAPPAFPPLAGSKIATGPTEAHIDIVLNGKPNTAMMAFGGQLSDADIAAVITYERSSWGNKASDVQPAEVKARRK